MLKHILTPFTTASSIGVAIRYTSTIIGAIVTILGFLGWLTPEQVEQLTQAMPELATAIGALVMAGIPVYAIITKAFSDKAAAAARVIDVERASGNVVSVKDQIGRTLAIVPPKSSSLS